MYKSLSSITILSLGFLASCTNPFQSTIPVTPVVPPMTIATGIVTPPAPVVTVLTPFVARGTEPFWALEQTATGARFSQPSMTTTTETWYTSIETIVGATISIVGTPVATGSALSATLTPGSCSDGMSDIVYTYTAVIILGTGTLSGCAN
ncbi:hypothetical protein H7170_01425 [Candidatus Gracilibacteria bacterium]|nr:hypothetical protein [Candidatus Gracilibacteria bacterium]